MLAVYLLAGATLGPAYSAFFAFFGAWNSLLAPAAFTVITAAAAILYRAGRDREAAVILVLGFWAGPAWCALFSGGIYSPLVIWLTPAPFMAGAVLGRRWALATGVLSTLFALTLGLFSLHSVFPNEFAADSAKHLLFVLTSTSAIGLITLYGYTTSKLNEDHVVAMEDKHAQLEASAKAIDAQAAARLLLLDNLEQGVLTINCDGTIAEERSAAADAFLGVPTPGSTFAEHLGQHDGVAGAMFELGLEALLEAYLPRDLLLSQLPAKFQVGESSFVIEYKVLERKEEIQALLTVITDVTIQLRHRAAEEAARETMSIFEHYTRDREGLYAFFDATTQGVERIAGDDIDETTLRRELHKIKGVTAQFGLTSMARHCHIIEDEIADCGRFTTELRQRVRHVWAETMDRLASFRAVRDEEHLSIEADAFHSLVDAVRDQHPYDEIHRMLVEWNYVPTRLRLRRLEEQATALAQRMRKGHVEVQIEDCGIRLPSQPWDGLWNALTHVVRNAIDHGLEPALERRLAGKPSVPTLSFATRVIGNQLLVTIADDGRGIAWEHIRLIAADRGWPAENREDLIQVLFTDGVSTRVSVTEISGRGVGMSVLANAVEERGGRIDITSEPGHGTRVDLTLPLLRAMKNRRRMAS